MLTNVTVVTCICLRHKENSGLGWLCLNRLPSMFGRGLVAAWQVFEFKTFGSITSPYISFVNIWEFSWRLYSDAQFLVSGRVLKRYSCQKRWCTVVSSLYIQILYFETKHNDARWNNSLSKYNWELGLTLKSSLWWIDWYLIKGIFVRTYNFFSDTCGSYLQVTISNAFWQLLFCLSWLEGGVKPAPTACKEERTCHSHVSFISLSLSLLDTV